MNFRDVLAPTAAYLGLNAAELERFAAETPKFENMPYGGFSIEREEGMFLYALARALQPAHALEIGVYDGVSSLHLLAALDANQHGDLISLDIRPQTTDVEHPRWTLRTADAITAELPPADFVYEDSDHGLTGAATILGKVKALAPRIVISHDYYSHEVYQDPVGFQVKTAFDGVFGADNVLGVRWDHGQRGFGLWRNPDWQPPTVEQAPPARKKPTPAKRAAKR